jgi:hypothetical protein
MAIQQLQDEDLEKASVLSRMMVSHVIPPAEVIKVLNRAKIRFVLVGAFGLARWLHEARATEDVDVVVFARQVKKVVVTLLDAFPHLEAVDLPVVTRLRQRDGKQAVLIDVMKPMQQPYREVFKHTVPATVGRQSCLIPSVEMALVMKFSAMTSLYRATKDKYQDAHDFINIATTNPDLDRDRAAALAQLIYPEAGKDILDLLDKARAGETFNI